jgi:hypothetical protein
MEKFHVNMPYPQPPKGGKSQLTTTWLYAAQSPL